MNSTELGWWWLRKDFAAADACREIIDRFGEKLKKLRMHLRNSSRHPDEDRLKLREIELILKELNRKKRGLLFTPPFFNESIRKSLKLCSDENTPSPANTPHMLASRLMVEWGVPTTSPYGAVKLIEMEKILERSFLVRWAYGIFLWGKVLFR